MLHRGEKAADELAAAGEGERQQLRRPALTAPLLSALVAMLTHAPP